MKKFTLIIMMLMSLINSGCEQAEFKTVYGKQASYSISIPTDFTDNIQVKEDGSIIDLEYGNSSGSRSVVTAIKNLPPDDTTDYLKDLMALSYSEFTEKMNPDETPNLRIFDRRIIDVNGVSSFFLYYRSEDFYFQVLDQFKNGKMLHLTCAYEYKKQDSLKPYFFQVINSLAWSKD